MKFQDSVSNGSQTSASVTHAQIDRQADTDPWTVPNQYTLQFVVGIKKCLPDGRQRMPALQVDLLSLLKGHG